METATIPTLEDVLLLLINQTLNSEQKIELARLLLDTLPQPNRVKLCCDVIDRDFLAPGQ